MKSWFLNRGYPSWFINKQMKKVKHSHLNDRKKAQKSQGVPLVITYHPLFKTFGNIISTLAHLVSRFACNTKGIVDASSNPLVSRLKLL